MIESWALSPSAHIAALPGRSGTRGPEGFQFRQRCRAQGRENLFCLGGHLAPNEFQPPLREARSVCKRVLCATALWVSIFLISKQSLFEVSENQRYTNPSERVSHNIKHRKQARGTEKPNR